MKFLDFIINNWYVIVAIIAVLIVSGIAIYKFCGLPTKEQVSKIKEWLLYMVVEAEKQLGNGTGKIKLRFVYDAFVTKFPTTARLISFETFSLWVDEALVKMKMILDENAAVRNYIEEK